MKRKNTSAKGYADEAIAAYRRTIDALQPKPKRKNTSRSGAAIELKAKAILEADGYLVHRAVRTPFVRAPGRFGSNSNDVFGCFDLVGLKRGYPVRFVQVTVHGKARLKERSCRPVAAHASADVADVEVWCFVPGRRPDGQRFRVTQWNGAGEWADCPDEVCA